VRIRLHRIHVVSEHNESPAPAATARIIFVTVRNDPIVTERSMATGALGYVLKLTACDELVPAALRGERHVSLRQRKRGDERQ
jgi:DNA-binding NarL/FixJ family response regulator